MNFGEIREAAAVCERGREVDRKEERSEIVQKLPERPLWIRVENNCRAGICKGKISSYIWTVTNPYHIVIAACSCCG